MLHFPHLTPGDPLVWCTCVVAVECILLLLSGSTMDCSWILLSESFPWVRVCRKQEKELQCSNDVIRLSWHHKGESSLVVSLAGSASQEAEGLLMSLHTNLTWWHGDLRKWSMSLLLFSFLGVFSCPILNSSMSHARYTYAKQSKFCSSWFKILGSDY